MPRLAIAALAAATLTACASGPQMQYYKDGLWATPETPEAYECIRDAMNAGNSVYVGFGYTTREPNQPMFHTCMRSKGWVLVQRGGQ